MSRISASAQSAPQLDTGGALALYNFDNEVPFPHFELASVPVDIPSDEELLSMDIQSGVCATLDSSGTLLVREVESDALLLREHVMNPHKLFLHPSASHLIVFSSDGEVFYFAPHDRRVRTSLRLQAGATNGSGFDASSLFSRSFRSTSNAFSATALSGAAKTGSASLVGECVGWISNDLCGHVEKSVANVEYVYALVGCNRDAAVFLLELAVGVNGKSPSARCMAFPAPPALIPTLPVASVLLEPSPRRGVGCFCVISNASQLFRLTFDAPPASTTTPGSSTSTVSLLISSLESGGTVWDVKEYPYVRDVTANSSGSSSSTARLGQVCGCFSVFRPSSSAAIHAYVWSNCFGLLHGVLPPPSPPTRTSKVDEKQEPLFGCEYVVPFANFAREPNAVTATQDLSRNERDGRGKGEGGAGRRMSEADSTSSLALFPPGIPTLAVPTAFHLILLFPHRCIVLNQPPGLCWETRSTSPVAAGGGVNGGKTRQEQGAQLAELLSRVRFDPFRNARNPASLSGLLRDTQERKLYVFGDRQLWELQVDGEHRRQWRLFLERAMDVEKNSLAVSGRLFRAAHQLSQGRPAAHNLVQFLRGQFYLRECNDPDEAATIWATCDWFDEVYALLRAHSSASASSTTLTDFLTKRFSRLARLYERASKSGKASPPPPTLAAATTTTAGNGNDGRSSPSAAPAITTATTATTAAASLVPQLAALVAFIVVEKLDAVTKQEYNDNGGSAATVPDGAPQGSISSSSSASSSAMSPAAVALEAFLTRAATEAPSLFSLPGFPALVLRLLEEQGRQDCALRLAPFTGQHAYVVAYHVALGHHAKAVDVLAKFSAGRPEMAAVWYEHASALIVTRPVALVTAMLRTMFKDEQAGRPQLLDLEKLLPALARYDPAYNEVEGNDENQVVVLLEQGLTRFQCVSTAVHTFYLSLLARLHDADRLEEFISGSLFYDHHFALRECLRHGNPQACILLYKQLRLYEDAVKMALRQSAPATTTARPESGGTSPWPGLSQAEDILRGVGGKVSDETIKRLWLLTAEYAMQQRGVQAALAVVEDSASVLHLDDILGKVPDDTVVQELKGVLLASLDRYTSEGTALRRRQEEAYQTAETVKLELGRLRHQYGYVAGHQRCLLCSRPLLQGTQPYVLYPSCQHVVHETCAVARLEEMGGLEAFFTDEGIAPYVLEGVCSLAELVQLDCVVCGEAAIVELDIPLCEEDASWKI